MELENKVIEGVHISRFIASFENAGGKIYGIYRYDGGNFIAWLKTIRVNDRFLTNDECDDIYEFAKILRCGKFELEQSAKEFLKEGA